MEDLCLVVSSFQHQFSIFYNNILFGSAVQSCSTAAANSSQESMQTKIVLFLVWKIKFHVKPSLRILSVLFWRAFFYGSWTVGPLPSYNHVQVRFVLKVISASLSYPS